jgi:DNA-binding NarL/FixJ family response regulator
VDGADNALRVVLADDHHFFREGLRDALAGAGIEVVGEAADGRGALLLAGELSPDVIVTDLKMPDELGVEAIRQLVAANPQTRVVVLTVSAEENDAIDALTAGACTYLLKDMRVDDVVGAIRQAARGHAVLSREVVRALVARVPAKSESDLTTVRGLPALTPRELDVLRLIVDGADNTAIGQALSISKHTAKQHVTNILEKLGVQGRVQAAVHAVRSGLV